MVAERHKLAAVKDRVEEPLEREKVGTRGVAIQAEVEAEVLPLIMDHRDKLRKHTLFRSERITRRRWTNPKSYDLTTGKSMRNTRVLCATYKVWCRTLSFSTVAAPGTCSLIVEFLRTSAPMSIRGSNVRTGR